MFFWANIMSGGCAGASGLFFVYPLDYARTRLSADIGRKGTKEFNGLIDCMVKTVKSNGIMGLYKGW